MTHKYFETLIPLYNHMDKTWNKIASGYNFQCTGCEDNCCKSLFFHHTYIEKAYFIHGFQKLDNDQKEKTIYKAQEYCKKTSLHASETKLEKIICPANEDGLCLLYQYRPMICRLHGLPHELTRPGFETVRSPGCAAGMFDGKSYIKFDRTFFYQQMARIESAFRRKFSKSGRIKETIAQMLISQ